MSNSPLEKSKPKRYKSGTVDGSIAERKRSELDSKEIGVQNYNRVVKIQESDQSSDGEFIPQKREEGESNPEADSDETLSDDLEDDPYQQTEKDIDQILCLTHDKPRPGYLAFRINQSVIGSKIFQEYQLTTEHQVKKLQDFKKTVNFGKFVSNLNPELDEPLSSPLMIDCFFIDRIISHKSNQNVAMLTSEMLDKKNVICGYPMDTLPPIDHMRVFTTPLQSVKDSESSFLSSDGVFHISNSLSENSEQNDSFLIAGDADAYFLVKWKGLGEEDATWENYNTISGFEPSLFCAANMLDFKRMTRIYWKKTIENQLFPSIIDFNPKIDLLPLSHGIKLKDAQQAAATFIMSRFSKNETAVIRCPATAGHTMTFASFLNTAINRLYHRKPALIITENINSWYTTFAVATDLYSVDYSGDKMSRNVIINKEMVGEYNAKFDVLFTTPEILITSTESIGSVKWEYIVIDKLDDFKLPSWLSRMATHKLYYIDSSIEKFTIPQRKYAIHVMEVEPDPYKEEIWLIPDNAADIIFKCLKKMLKGKPYRSYDFFSIAYYLQTAYSHPFLIHEMRDLIIKIETENEEEEMSHEDFVELMGDASEKFLCVLQMALEAVQENKVVAVVCNGFNIMRLLKQYLDHKDVPSAFLNSPLTSEVFHDTFTTGVLFMTREFASRDFDKLDIKTVIFYDINDELWKDLLLGDFMRQKYDATIVRLITKDSVELLFFGHLLEKGEFEAHDLERTCAETYVRYGITSTAPWRKAQDMDYTRMYVSYPEDTAEIIETFLNRPRSTVSIEFSFWNTCFTREDKSQRAQQDQNSQIDTSQWNASKGRDLLDGVCRFGIFNWNQVAKSVNKHVDDAKMFAVTLLALMSSKVQSGNYKSLNYFLYDQHKLNTIPQNPSDWKKAIKKIKNLHRDTADNILKDTKTFGKFEKFLEGVNQKIITDAYKSISPGLFPRRFYARKADYPTQEEFSEIISGTRPITKQTMPLYKCIVNDVLSAATHSERHTVPLDFIRDVINNTENVTQWSDHQVNQVYNMLQVYGIPTKENGDTDPLEIISLCEIFDKEPDDITAFCEGFLLEILKFQHGSFSLVLPKELTHNQMVIEILAEKILQNRSKIIAMMAARRCVSDKKNTNYDLSSAPADWKNDHDVAMFEFACQYGLDAARIYFDTKTSENYKGADCKASKNTVAKLNALLPTRPSISRRIAFIVQTVATTRPTYKERVKYKEEKPSKKVSKKSKELSSSSSEEEEQKQIKEEEEEDQKEKTKIQIERGEEENSTTTTESEDARIDIQSDEPLSETNIPEGPPDTSEEEVAKFKKEKPPPPPPKPPKPRLPPKPKEPTVFEKMETRSAAKKLKDRKRISDSSSSSEDEYYYYSEDEEEDNEADDEEEETFEDEFIGSSEENEVESEDVVVESPEEQEQSSPKRRRGRPRRVAKASLLPIPKVKMPKKIVLPLVNPTLAAPTYNLPTTAHFVSRFHDIANFMKDGTLDQPNLMQIIREGKVKAFEIFQLALEGHLPQNLLIQVIRERKLGTDAFITLFDHYKFTNPTICQMLIEGIVPQERIAEAIQYMVVSSMITNAVIDRLRDQYPGIIHPTKRAIKPEAEELIKSRGVRIETTINVVQPPQEVVLPPIESLHPVSEETHVYVPLKHIEPEEEETPKKKRGRKRKPHQTARLRNAFVLLPPPPMFPQPPQPQLQPQQALLPSPPPPPPPMMPYPPNSLYNPAQRMVPGYIPLPNSPLKYPVPPGFLLPMRKRGRGRPPGSRNKVPRKRRPSEESDLYDDDEVAEVTELPKTRSKSREEEEN